MALKHQIKLLKPWLSAAEPDCKPWQTGCHPSWSSLLHLRFYFDNNLRVCRNVPMFYRDLWPACACPKKPFLYGYKKNSDYPTLPKNRTLQHKKNLFHVTLFFRKHQHHGYFHQSHCSHPCPPPPAQCHASNQLITSSKTWCVLGKI